MNSNRVRNKILLTGANGLLGRNIVNVLKKEYNVIPLTRKELNLENTQEIIPFLGKIAPSIIIHCAAYTDVDKAEEEKDRVFKINWISTKMISLFCEKKEIPLMFISTDYVFDGKRKEGYNEWDAPNPLNVYGLSKYHAEMEVKHILKKFFVIRTSWLFGEGRKNFVNNFLEKTKKGKTYKIVRDQIGSPTYTQDLALSIKKIIEEGIYGVYHITNTGVCTRQEFASEILKISGILKKDKKIKRVRLRDFPFKAKRPKYCILNNNIYTFLFGSLPGWKEALRTYLLKKSV